MPIIEPLDPTIKDLKGLHVWHSELSSCAQRVRITLDEKGLGWEGHLIDIPKNEHATPEYQAINPKGLVPAFVDHGTLLIESCDIIDYIDKKYPDPRLRPSDPILELKLSGWLDRADKAQADLKLLSHEFLFRPRKLMTESEVVDFEISHNNKALVDFIREWQGNNMFPKIKLDAAVTRTDTDFKELDSALADQHWVIGDQFTLADIAWMPNIHRVMLMEWPLERYKNLSRWFDQLKARSSYRSALVAWEPEGLRDRFANYVAKRKKETGIHVTAFGALVEAH